MEEEGGSEGSLSMFFRATRMAFVIGALLLGALGQAGAAGPETRAADDFPVASDVRLGGDETQTRLVVDLSHKIDIRAFTLANPYRVVIDLPQVTFNFPAEPARTAAA